MAVEVLGFGSQRLLELPVGSGFVAPGTAWESVLLRNRMRECCASGSVGNLGNQPGLPGKYKLLSSIKRSERSHYWDVPGMVKRGAGIRYAKMSVSGIARSGRSGVVSVS